MINTWPHISNYNERSLVGLSFSILRRNIHGMNHSLESFDVEWFFSI